MAHTLPSLPYPYNALEPYISEEIMTLHHTKHHQTYVNGLNAAEAAYEKAKTVKERIALGAAIRFNGGGHINHSLFWANLAPSSSNGKGGGVGGILKDGPLKDAIHRSFGGLDALKEKFNKIAAGIEGSGWGWVVLNTNAKNTSTGTLKTPLEILTTPNQDPLLPPYVPIIGVDVWEHAFYLQYKNVKGDYLSAIWNVINFEEAERRYLEAVGVKDVGPAKL
ncbi:hypothetical protein D9758_010845 [Tetrapyrgos nigripes]|uniref:Superoxide dismutase n=1 Tax=Tetrapyrgos nigripes TaxID=182062 RepID=A0A8H5GIB3_9AGAR|nr:hypothetical protein D9758_010845 [Tetrapyrgos nigripes]